MVRGLRLCASTSGVAGSIPGWRTKIPHDAKKSKKEAVRVREREVGREQSTWPRASWPLEVESEEQTVPERKLLCPPLDYNPLRSALDFWPPELLRDKFVLS